jgi:hypothetical protein
MGTTFEDQAPLFIFLAVVFVLVSTAIFAYQFSSNKTRQPVRRIALWAAAVVSTMVAFLAVVGFGVPILEDFRNPHVEFREAVIGTSIVWPICLGAWFVAVRCLIAALRRDASPPNHS